MPKTFHFTVTGTHCASCEIVIERDLKKLPGVLKVNAKRGANTVDVTMKEGESISAKQCSALFEKQNYHFTEVHPSIAEEAEAGSMFTRILFAVVAIAVIYFIITKTGILNYAPNDATGKGLLAVALVGIVASFSSCTAVVSGFLVAISAKVAQENPNASFTKKIRPHLLFNAGRILGFAGFGALIGLIGSKLELSSTANGIMVIIIAALMIAIGVDLLHALPSNLGIHPPKWLSHKIHDLVDSKHPFAPMILGAATFFLPCGFTQSMQLYALSTGSPIQSAMIMTVFAIGTLPALLGFGAITSALKGKALQWMTFGVGAAVVALGIANIGNGAALLGWSGFSFPDLSSSDTTPAINTLVDGKQLITMEASALGYFPKTLTVKKGIPVDWQIFGGQNMGCASTLIMKAFNVDSPLRPGDNDIYFTPTKTGSFAFSCSMGMVRGTMVVVE